MKYKFYCWLLLDFSIFFLILLTEILDRVKAFKWTHFFSYLLMVRWQSQYLFGWLVKTHKPKLFILFEYYCFLKFNGAYGVVYSWAVSYCSQYLYLYLFKLEFIWEVIQTKLFQIWSSKYLYIWVTFFFLGNKHFPCHFLSVFIKTCIQNMPSESRRKVNQLTNTLWRVMGLSCF